MNITSIARHAFAARQRALDAHYGQGERLQREALDRLVARGAKTEYGHHHGLDAVLSTHGDRYACFAKQSPLNDYDSLKADIDRMRHGGRDVLWPGRVKWYAKSSGTTNDRSKFIPVSSDGLHGIHYQGGKDVVALYLRDRPDARLFDGRSLILGGSHEPNCNLPGSLVGDLSAILIENINPLVNLVRVPRKSTALMADFDKKRDRIARECLRQDVTNLSGVPSWMLSVLVRVMELAGAETLDQVWPHLEVFFHGGIPFGPYREQYRRLIRSPRMQYMETYNASEGFFGIQDDPADRAMLLMLDYGVFYEFAPLDEVRDHPFVPQRDNPYTPDWHIVPLWEVQTGVDYAMLITTSCGLWRYIIGDTVRFTSRDPYKFVISGRTKYFINAFGEELVMDNAERGLQRACQETGAVVSEYHACPMFMDSRAKCAHQWLVEFAAMPDSVERFADKLDEALQALNSDYAAKRANNTTMQRLRLQAVPKGTFEQWLRSKGKLGGQHKVPKLSNDRKIMEELLAMLREK